MVKDALESVYSFVLWL